MIFLTFNNNEIKRPIFEILSAAARRYRIPIKFPLYIHKTTDMDKYLTRKEIERSKIFLYLSFTPYIFSSIATEITYAKSILSENCLLIISTHEQILQEHQSINSLPGRFHITGSPSNSDAVINRIKSQLHPFVTLAEIAYIRLAVDLMALTLLDDQRSEREAFEVNQLRKNGLTDEQIVNKLR